MYQYKSKVQSLGHYAMVCYYRVDLSIVNSQISASGVTNVHDNMHGHAEGP